MGHLEELNLLYVKWKNTFPTNITPLSSNSGGPRLYFRIYSEKNSIIGAYGSDLKENNAFFYYTKLFHSAGMSVPELYISDSSLPYYLVEDLGDLNLLDLLKFEGESERIKLLYQKAIHRLIEMQIFGGEQCDFNSYAYPRAAFDSQSILWDLNYFKYYFLKMTEIPFDEQLLENDFQILAYRMSEIGGQNFMFRDFQARNIQIRNDEVWFIDYQGGRKGPMLYDLVSLLYQASANLSPAFRDKLKNEYKQVVLQKEIYVEADFENDFYSILFIRILQTLGTYGYRGLIEGKMYFKESIPLALANLEKLIYSSEFKWEIPYFLELLKQILKYKSKFVTNL
jgi:aminoglycoside/choline kinase family phosphotransferase